MTAADNRSDSSNTFSKEHVLDYIDQFLQGMGIQDAKVDIERFEACFREIEHLQAQSYSLTMELSPFKSAAAWIISFVRNAPLRTPFTEEVVGELARIPNHQNIILALFIALDSLRGATIVRNGEVIVLRNPPRLSRHYYTELIHALASSSGDINFPTLALLLESLSYQTNPEAAYQSMSWSEPPLQKKERE